MNQFLIIYHNQHTPNCLKQKFNLQKLIKLNLDFLFLFNILKKKTYHEYHFYQYYNLYYLKNVFNVELKEKSINCQKILPKKVIKYILFKTRNIHYKRFNIKYFNKVIYMILVDIWLKDSKHLSQFIKKKLDTTHFKRHKSYFLFFFRIFTRYVVPNFRILKLKGITLKFKGKLGRGGNARKKTIFYHKGHYSLTNRMLALNKNS